MMDERDLQLLKQESEPETEGFTFDDFNTITAKLVLRFYGTKNLLPVWFTPFAYSYDEQLRMTDSLEMAQTLVNDLEARQSDLERLRNIKRKLPALEDELKMLPDKEGSNKNRVAEINAVIEGSKDVETRILEVEKDVARMKAEAKTQMDMFINYLNPEPAESGTPTEGEQKSRKGLLVEWGMFYDKERTQKVPLTLANLKRLPYAAILELGRAVVRACQVGKLQSSNSPDTSLVTVV